MRYPSDHKSEARRSLVSAGASVAKKSGFAASGVDALSRAAGVTSGAFYKHFEGKEALLAAIVESELEATRARFSSADARSAESLFRAIDAYLSLAHVRHPEGGCVLPALAAEVARASAATRRAFERAMRDVLTALAEAIGDASTASAVVSLCVGAVTIARGLESEEAQRQVLASARKSARALIASIG
jgi:AcrR family transcriptional regulator